MPDFGSPVAQNVKGPDMGMLSDMMSFKQKQLDYQKSQDTYGAAVAQKQAESSLAQTNASVAGQTADSKVAMQKAQTGFEQFKLTGAHAAQATQLASSFIGDPAFVNGDSAAMTEKLNGAQKTMTDAYGVDPKTADAIITTLKFQALHHPEQVRQSLINMTQQQQGGAGQQAAALPNPQMIQTGNTVTPVASGNPALTGVQPGTPQGQPVPMGLPPSTPVMRGGTPGYLGGDPKVASGPALGQAAGVEGPVATNNAHYAGIQQAAQSATAHIGVLDNISSLAHGAATGDNAAWKKVVTGFAGWLGISTDKATATDVMAKEVALAAKGAGRTDLENLMNQSATPGGKMTEDAIRITAAQLIGRDKAALAAQQFFAGTPTNSPFYTEKMGQWAKNGDPQAFEFAAKSPEDQAKLKAELVKTGKWSGLASKMRALHGMGIEP